MEHPKTNGQAETVNKVILGELKKRLGGAKGMWDEELQVYCGDIIVPPQSSTKETLFWLAYGADVMVPVEVQESSLRRQYYQLEINEVIRR